MISSHVLVSTQPPSPSWPFILVIQWFSTKIQDIQILINFSDFSSTCVYPEFSIKNQKKWPKFGWSRINQILVNFSDFSSKFGTYKLWWIFVIFHQNSGWTKFWSIFLILFPKVSYYYQPFFLHFLFGKWTKMEIFLPLIPFSKWTRMKDVW